MLDIFLIVVERLGVFIEKCLVFEDFVVGMEAVLVVGMLVVVVLDFDMDKYLFYLVY